MSQMRAYVPTDYPALEPLARAVHADLPACPLQYHREWQIAIDAPEQHRSGACAYVVQADSGQIVGYGSIWPTTSRLAIRMHILVAPPWQGQGIGSRLYERLLTDLQPLQVPYVQARIRDARTQAVAFASRRGFAVTQHMVYLRLRVANANPDAFTPLFQRLAGRGIVLTTLAEEQKHEPACWARLCDLFNAVHPDTPEGQISPGNPVAETQFVDMLQGCLDLPDAHFIAKVDNQYIGWSPLTQRDAEAGALNVGILTGVRREYRRQGVATALKVQTIAYAKQHGFREIVTKTANPAMLSLMEKLGFQHESGEVRLLKALLPPPLRGVT